MSDREPKKKLVGPWRNIHAAVWLIGLAILALKNWWWPGILVLVAISVLLEAVLMRFAPSAFQAGEAPETPPSADQAAAPAPAAAEQTAAAQHRLELLPAVCPKCGGPIRGHDVKWTGPQSADCPFCGANLPLSPAG